MKKLVIGLIIALIAVYFIGEMMTPKSTYDTNNSSEYNSSYSSESSTSSKWYVGGTLHKKTIADWKSATSENKLATCADFVTKVKSMPLDELKVASYELQTCIDEATRDLPETDSQKVAEVGALCLITLGYN